MHTDPPVVVSLKEADSDYSERGFVLNCREKNAYRTANTIQLLGSPSELASTYTCMAKNSRNQVASQAINISGM